MNVLIPRLNTETDAVDFPRRHPTAEADAESRDTVRGILDDVRGDGWDAVNQFTKEFDGVKPRQKPLPERALIECWDRLDESTRRSLRTAKQRVKRYQEVLANRSTLISDGGGYLGDIVRPYERVGCYIPGGRFPLPSTVLMTAYIAQVAGVEEIVVCTPPGEGKDPNPVTQAACSLLENVDVFGIGGVQAVGAMTYGLDNLSPVDLIVGPGNLYVTLAKKEVYGTVEIDMLAGPSEIAVVADEDHATPEYVAADLLSQAEHDPMSRAYLLTPSERLADAVESSIADQLDELNQTKPIREALKSSALITTSSTDEAISLVEELAPEHLELHLENPGTWARNIQNAGAIFCGQQTPEPLGDYVAGPSHTLPTGGGARYFSPLNIRTFQKSQSLLSSSHEEHGELRHAAKTIADVETLDAHARSVSVRNKGGES